MTTVLAKSTVLELELFSNARIVLSSNVCQTRQSGINPWFAIFLYLVYPSIISCADVDDIHCVEPT